MRYKNVDALGVSVVVVAQENRRTHGWRDIHPFGRDGSTCLALTT